MRRSGPAGGDATSSGSAPAFTCAFDLVTRRANALEVAFVVVVARFDVVSFGGQTLSADLAERVTNEYMSAATWPVGWQACTAGAPGPRGHYSPPLTTVR